MNLLEVPILSWSRARSAGYLLEYRLFNTLARAVSPFGWNRAAAPTPDLKTLWAIRKNLDDLLARDSRNIAEGVYPLSVLRPGSPVKHLLRLPFLVADGVSLQRRRARGRTTEFSATAREKLEDLPRYYRRNFHYQTDGYLSERSAELYDHQVEMLFAGAADAMRRLILPPMREALGTRDGRVLTSKGKARPLRILEIAAGAGSATRFAKLAFPKAKLVASDMSAAYLKTARKNLARFEGVDFVQADGAKLPFRAGYFDAVFSVFLFHELPLEERRAVLRESLRVLKPGGFLGMVDSIQKDDCPELNETLESFPRDFHEPYYRNYLENPMPKLMRETGVEDVRCDQGFFSKVCYGSKPARLKD